MLQGHNGRQDDASAYPSLSQQLTFRAKATLLQLHRSIRNRWVNPVQTYTKASALRDQPILATSKTPLRSSQDALEDRLIAGKIQNLRIALQHINGIELPKDGIFSFWGQIGMPSQHRGYAIGREIRQGCLIPSVGGGLCQLSNALYSLALDTGAEIVERHAHTLVVPGSLAEMGRDATVFWNYVDLRFKAPVPLRIEAFLTSSDLVVQFRGQGLELVTPTQPSHQPIRAVLDNTHQCDTCTVVDCLKHMPPNRPQQSWERTAYLVDEYWPEFDRYLQTHRSAKDLLALPLNGKQWQKANYAWTTHGFGTVRSAAALTLGRSLASRRLATQGRARQQQLLQSDRQLAQSLGQWLTAEVTHIVVMQQLLPFLWQQGDLGGRSFDVLMTRLPLSLLQARLDQAHRKHPSSPTLCDFRTDPALVAAEAQALRSARRLITPHTDLANLFPEKTTLLDWDLPHRPTHPVRGQTILFPASTLGRKGAYELREAAKTLNLPLQLLGTDLEGENFWEGLNVWRSPLNSFAGIGLVVLPAYVEHTPRILLQAIAQGIPVIASVACGLEHMPGVMTIPTGDEQALIQAIRKELDRSDGQGD
ncbi:MAG: VanW family protein [Thermosynechococcaceae cyanobacterium]